MTGKDDWGCAEATKAGSSGLLIDHHLLCVITIWRNLLLLYFRVIYSAFRNCLDLCWWFLLLQWRFVASGKRFSIHLWNWGLFLQTFHLQVQFGAMTFCPGEILFYSHIFLSFRLKLFVHFRHSSFEIFYLNWFLIDRFPHRRHDALAVGQFAYKVF